MSGRYVIGPWVGSRQGGVCQLGNDEPLAGAGFFLHGKEGGTAWEATVGGDAVSLDVDAMKRQSFYRAGSYTYDLHGFARAAALFQACLMGEAAPSVLPDEPLQESEPVAIPATAWQMTTLTMADGYVYARYAFLPEQRPITLGVWAYGPGQFLLSLSSLRGVEVSAPTHATLTLEQGPALTAPVFAQETSLLLPLSPSALGSLKRAHRLRVQAGAMDESYTLGPGAFSAVLAALSAGKEGTPTP